MRTHYRNGDEITLTATGCDGCSPSIINGTLCHERGCPDAWKDTPKACYVCGCDFYQTERMQAVCEDCQESEIESEQEIESRPLEWWLSDDGTMDTVIYVVCRWCEHQHEVRYDCDFAAEYRDESGTLDCDAFGEAIASEDFECPDCGRQA